MTSVVEQKSIYRSASAQPPCQYLVAPSVYSEVTGVSLLSEYKDTVSRILSSTSNVWMGESGQLFFFLFFFLFNPQVEQQKKLTLVWPAFRFYFGNGGMLNFRLSKFCPKYRRHVYSNVNLCVLCVYCISVPWSSMKLFLCAGASYKNTSLPLSLLM